MSRQDDADLPLPGSLEDRVARLESFAATAAHDMREPLRMIRSYLSLLERRERESFSEEGAEYLKTAMAGAARLSDLLDGLLCFARYGQAPLGKPRPLQGIVEDVLQDLALLIAETGTLIELGDLSTAALPHLEGRQLLMNLIGNAIRYRAEGPVRVLICVERHGSDQVVLVKDNGRGVSPEMRLRIFEPFVREESASASGPGVGLGLATCRRVVESWGGRIWHEPGGEGGSMFCFTAPAATL